MANKKTELFSLGRVSQLVCLVIFGDPCQFEYAWKGIVKNILGLYTSGYWTKEREYSYPEIIIQHH